MPRVGQHTGFHTSFGAGPSPKVVVNNVRADDNKTDTTSKAILTATRRGNETRFVACVASRFRRTLVFRIVRADAEEYTVFGATNGHVIVGRELGQHLVPGVCVVNAACTVIVVRCVFDVLARVSIGPKGSTRYTGRGGSRNGRLVTARKGIVKIRL